MTPPLNRGDGEVTLVERNKQFAQRLVALCREFGAYSLDIKFTLPDPSSSPFEEARMTFHKGRHDAAGTINLIVTTHIGDFAEQLQSEDSSK